MPVKSSAMTGKLERYLIEHWFVRRALRGGHKIVIPVKHGG